jgi:hypothetical protein
MELDIQRLAGRKVGGDSLIQPEPYLLFIFGVLGQWLLLRHVAHQLAEWIDANATC